MLEKVSACWNLFRKGEEVANPEAWKNAHNFGLILGAAILALINVLKAFDVKFPVSMDVNQANVIGFGLATLFSFVLNNITSARAGILPAKNKPAQPVPAANGDAESDTDSRSQMQSVPDASETTSVVQPEIVSTVSNTQGGEQGSRNPFDDEFTKVLN